MSRLCDMREASCGNEPSACVACQRLVDSNSLTVCCSVLQLFCSVVQCGAVWSSVLQGVAVCCSELQFVAASTMSRLPHVQEIHQKMGNRSYKQRVVFAKEAMRERER